MFANKKAPLEVPPRINTQGIFFHDTILNHHLIFAVTMVACKKNGEL